MAEKTITKRQKEILRYIKDYMLKNGITPTIREIGVGVGLYSTSTVQAHFNRLAECGYIERTGKNYTVNGMRYTEDQSSSDVD